MSAVFSPCGTWRLRLDRDVGGLLAGPLVGWMLHNPSTAGAENEDPTSRRGISFTRRFGGSRLVYLNPWAGRATKPADLWRMADPVGPENDRVIAEALAEIRSTRGFVVAAWGRISPPAAMRTAAEARLAAVEAMIRGAGLKLFALGVNADGSPKHPLYVRGDATLVPWGRE